MSEQPIEADELDLPTAAELRAEQLERDAPEVLVRDHRGRQSLRDEP